jgi:hypothetical protein
VFECRCSHQLSCSAQLVASPSLLTFVTVAGLLYARELPLLAILHVLFRTFQVLGCKLRSLPQQSFLAASALCSFQLPIPLTLEAFSSQPISLSLLVRLFQCRHL